MLVFLFIVLAISTAFVVGWRRTQTGENFHSRPFYYASYSAIVIGLPLVLLSTLWLVSEPLYVKPLVVSTLNSASENPIKDIDFRYLEIKQISRGSLNITKNKEISELALESYHSAKTHVDYLIISLMLLSTFLGAKTIRRRVRPLFKAREKVETFIKGFLALSSVVAILTTMGIVLSLVFETLRFFQHVPFFDFLFGTHWSPQTALRADQAGSSGSFGAIPLFAGTLLIAFIAMIVAVPIGLFSAIYLAEYAQARTRSIVKPALEILAGIPTVVYGFFAALTVAPMLVDLARYLSLSASSESALAAGLVMGVMIIPFISSLSEDVIASVPQSLRDGSLAMGATKAETVKKVVLPAALPGIVSSLILGFSRAIGETMIVVMAAGLAANMTINPLESVTTITAQIVTILVGDQSFDSPKTLAAFALGLSLFCLTLFLNIIALKVVRKYREQYD